jgi:hypothetical protein
MENLQKWDRFIISLKTVKSKSLEAAKLKIVKLLPTVAFGKAMENCDMFFPIKIKTSVLFEELK